MSNPAQTDSQRSVFLLGATGYIGGSVTTALLSENKYKITALTRNESKGDKLKSIGVTPLVGSFDDEDLIEKATREHDIIIHCASSDDAPSVKAILRGLEDCDQPKVWIHTSGTAVLAAASDPKKTYSDKHPEDIDALPDSAPHRKFDLLIKNAIDEKKVGKARIAIMLPPTIYGEGDGLFNRTSIDIPFWIRESIKNKQVTLWGEREKIWSNVHIENLERGYLTLLNKAEETDLPSLYYFCETGRHTWGQVADKIRELLLEKKLIDTSEYKELKNEDTKYAMGTHSISQAEYLREWGWKPKDLGSIFEAVPHELEMVLKGKKE